MESKARHTFSVIWRGSARCHISNELVDFFCSIIQDPAHINNFIFPVMAFFPEPKSFGSADSRQEAARGRPRGAGERQRDGGGIDRDGRPGGGC